MSLALTQSGSASGKTAIDEKADSEDSEESLISRAPSQAKRRGRPPKGENMPKYDKRLQIKLTDEGRERLDVLVGRTGADGIGEVVRDALRIYDIITEEVYLKENNWLLRDSADEKVRRVSFWGDFA